MSEFISKPVGSSHKISPVAIGIALVILVWGLGAGFVYLVTRPSTSKPSTVQTKPEVKTVFHRVIDGVLVADETLEDPVIYGAMIDNILEARPPAGLSKASLVYEVPVEMGLTRFLAIYADGNVVPKIGPIRSARPYAVDLMTEFNGMYLHIGGSPAALDQIMLAPNVFGVDEFADSKTIFRVKTRSAPHNAYTTSDNVGALIKKQTHMFGPVAPWLYRDEKKLEERSGNAGVLINFSSIKYEAEWKYDPTLNEYIRYEGRVRHKDEDGTEIYAKNIAVMVTTATVVPGDDKGRLNIPVTGEGVAYVFSEGAVTRGMWKKASLADRLRFYDSEGGEVSFVPGTTWVEVAPSMDKVKIKE